MGRERERERYELSRSRSGPPVEFEARHDQWDASRGIGDISNKHGRVDVPEARQYPWNPQGHAGATREAVSATSPFVFFGIGFWDCDRIMVNLTFISELGFGIVFELWRI